MKLLRFEVRGLFGRETPIAGVFNSDMNIITGKNGAGKTSLLKLIWYVISGNILLAITEVNFKSVTIVTDMYECTVWKLTRNTCKVEMVIDGKKMTFEDDFDPSGDYYESAEDAANPRLIERGSSVFFPTFRRIEGGFTLGEPRRTGVLAPRSVKAKGDVEEALLALSRKLSNAPHIFVSAISTADIVSLLLRQYTDLSEESNKLQQKTSQDIIQTIKNFKSDRTEVPRIDSANNVIDQIRLKIEEMELERDRVMMPIGAVRNLVVQLFKHSGIKINSRFSFGDAANAINSDSLSAGEKQMLSFICYNAFYNNAIIIIDEPELSLHVDWQRQLFAILSRQQSSNQFVVATHSPFIYSKYPDKEICLDDDRGNSEG